MTEAYTGHDRIGLYLSGGANNQSPSLALGGAISSRLVWGMAPQYINAVAGAIVEDATPENGSGTATVLISGDQVTYTPPGGVPGASETILGGERKILSGADETKAIRLYRVSGESFSGVLSFTLIDVMNGVVSMGNVSDADRVSGNTWYRAFFVKAHDTAAQIKLWVTTTGQSTYALAAEAPVSDSIQTIADELTAPIGVSWVNAVSEGTALNIGSLSAGQTYGVWIRKIFPAAGTIAAEETVNLHQSHQGI